MRFILLSCIAVLLYTGAPHHRATHRHDAIDVLLPGSPSLSSGYAMRDRLWPRALDAESESLLDTSAFDILL